MPYRSSAGTSVADRKEISVMAHLKKNYFFIREFDGYKVAYGLFYILRKLRSVNEMLFL